MTSCVSIIKVFSDIFVCPWVAFATVFTFAISVILLILKPALSFRFLLWQKRKSFAKYRYAAKLVHQLD